MGILRLKAWFVVGAVSLNRLEHTALCALVCLSEANNQIVAKYRKALTGREYALCSSSGWAVLSHLSSSTHALDLDTESVEAEV